MSKKDVFRFLEDFEEAMKPLKKKYGVFIFEREVISAEQDTFSFKVQVSNEEKEKEKQFKQNCQYFSNVDESMYQQIFQGNDGQLYTLIGLNPIAKKNPHSVRKTCRTLRNTLISLRQVPNSPNVCPYFR